MPKGDGRPMGTELSLKVCYNYKFDDGWITNTKFKELVSEAFKEAVDSGQIDQIGDKAYEIKNGRPVKDHPFLIKKSEIARYFGLIEYIWRKKQKITPLGIKYFEANNKEERIKIIFNSLSKLSFNKGNWGVKKSNSIVEPPRLLLRAIYDLKYLTNKEFAWILYRTADHQKPYHDTIKEILELRTKQKDTPQIPKGKDSPRNKYNDVKFKVFFEKINIIKIINKDYYLSDFIVENYLPQIRKLNIYNIFTKVSKSLEKSDRPVYTNLVYPISEKSNLLKLENAEPQKNKKGKYTRNPKIAQTVLAASRYKCFFDPSHETFTNKNGEIYMEGHHFIPMQFQEDFLPISLDRRSNLVCLCPNCHEKLHKARNEDRLPLLRKIYDLRIKDLIEEGIKISFEELARKYYN